MKKAESRPMLDVGWAELFYFVSFGVMFAAKGVGLDEAVWQENCA